MSCLGNQGGFCLTPVRFAPVQLSCSSWISGFCLVRGFDFVLFVAFALEHVRLPALQTRVRDVHCTRRIRSVYVSRVPPLMGLSLIHI
mgnify:CR=1 FL=1